MILPYGCDELGVAGAAQGFPVRVVKARTVDAWAIADSEVVIEGYVDPRDRRFETAEAEADQTQGKHHFHPEWAGYMGKAYKAPTFHVTAVTMRKDAKRIIYCWARTPSTSTTSTPRSARRRCSNCATGCSPASSRTSTFPTA